MAFTKKEIRVDLVAPGGSYSFAGLRTSVQMEDFGGPVPKNASIRIHGVSKDHMAALSTFQPNAPDRLLKTTVAVYAGDAEHGMPVAFCGLVAASWADMVGMPDVALQIIAHGIPIDGILPTSDNSYPGDVAVADFMATVAGLMGLKLHNNGVSSVLHKPHFWGTPYAQMIQCAEAAHIETRIFSTADGGGWLAIWPSNGDNGLSSVQVSAETGLVGYPSFDGQSVTVTTLYNPLIKFGTKVVIKTGFHAANGTMITNGGIMHHIESYTPNGSWFTQATGRMMAGGG
jgi:hypothetical protein